MPDYEYRLWDMKAIAEIDVPFVREALECRKWAFAADYVRLWAVEKFGGIYIDTDVELLSSLDPFLDCRLFIGREEYHHVRNWYPQQFLTSHLFGAEPHHPFIKDCLLYYTTRHFKISDDTRLPDELRFDFRIAPEVKSLVAAGYGYESRMCEDHMQHCAEGMEIYPSKYFGSCFRALPGAVCVHHCLGSWMLAQHKGPLNDVKASWWRSALGKTDLGGKFLAFVRDMLKRSGYVIYKS